MCPLARPPRHPRHTPNPTPLALRAPRDSAPTLRVVGQEKEPVGVMSREDALRMADEADVDLVRTSAPRVSTAASD